MNYLLCVNIDHGKYTVIQEEGGRLHALRYGEPWRDLCGDGLVYSMAAEIDRLRSALIEISRMGEGYDTAMILIADKALNA